MATATGLLREERGKVRRVKKHLDSKLELKVSAQLLWVMAGFARDHPEGTRELAFQLRAEESPVLKE